MDQAEGPDELLNRDSSFHEVGEEDSKDGISLDRSSGSVSLCEAPSANRNLVLDRNSVLDKEQVHDRNCTGDGYPSVNISNGTLLPWGVRKERIQFPASVHVDTNVKPGEFIMRTLFAEFTVMVEMKINAVIEESLERPLNKDLQRGEDASFDQLLISLGSVAEHCLPSILRTLFAWYDRQGVDWNLTEQKQKGEGKGKGDSTDKTEKEYYTERRDLAVEFIFCLVLVEVLKQLPFHPGHEDLISDIESLAFRHFKYREHVQNSPNAMNFNIIADLYAEVIGVLAQSRFQSVRKKFMSALKELRSKEPSPFNTQSIISLLMGMKLFRVKMAPIEEFEASFQFMRECAVYFLEVKDKDIKHALAGLFVEILVPVAATVKNEVNVPVLKNFVEMLYSQTLDMSTKKKQSLALFPLVTCLLCVSQKQFFLQNWHYFLAMCLHNLKNRDPKMSRVALESLYRLLWVYMIRIKCESNTATTSRLQSIVNSLFPKGSKSVVPRDTPLNIFVKIIQFIAQERLDFAMKEIVFDLLSVGRPIKIILTPERMSIGLRAFLVVTDSLQQKEGEPPMPRTLGVLPSGNTLRVKKTFLNKMLSEATAKTIGISAYYPYVRKVFNDILRALDCQYGRPFMMTVVQNVNKEPEELITGERRPKIDLFRTCIAAVPRLVPDGMTRSELVDLLSRLTVHMDEELKGLAYQSLQNLILDFPDWQEEVVFGYTQFVVKEVTDVTPLLLESCLRILLQLMTAWKNMVSCGKERKDSECASNKDKISIFTDTTSKDIPENMGTVLHYIEGFALVMICNIRPAPRRLAVHILREAKLLLRLLDCKTSNAAVLDEIDIICPSVIEKCINILPPAEKSAITTACNIDLQWLSERSSTVWTSGFVECGSDGSWKPVGNQVFSSNDAWSICLNGFLDSDDMFNNCSTAISQSWPIAYSRLTSLYTVIDPNPLTDNRASLLRSSSALKKPVTEKDIQLSLWQNYALFACRVVPPNNPSLTIRCASPDLNLNSSPEGLFFEKPESRCGSASLVSPSSLYKLLVPLLRCDSQPVRDAVVYALGAINAPACRYLMEELVGCIKEAIDRKQENMRRRRRRDTLRLYLVKLFEIIAERGTFGKGAYVLDKETQSFHGTFVEYIDGARLYLEMESEKDVPCLIKEIKNHFCNFISKLIKSFPLETRQTLFSQELRQNLFYLLSPWSGKFIVNHLSLEKRFIKDEPVSDFELSALQAKCDVLCCGPSFDPCSLSEEGYIYSWLDTLLESHDPKIYSIAQETIVLLLEFNSDIGPLLDWVVDRCYTGSNEVADGCFMALATIFSAREYPCDHYTAIINVTLLNTGCPRANISETALQLLQVLDKRFFGTISPVLNIENCDGDICCHESTTLDKLLSSCYSRRQQYLSQQLSYLHPELTMPMFSEITCRFQNARFPVRQLLLQYLLPWLHNMELVDPNIPPANPLSYCQYYSNDVCQTGGKREGKGSVEATEMILNNLFYITSKFGDDFPKELEKLWAALCSYWPNNLKVILRYLFIVTGMAPDKLLEYAKRVVVYLGRACPERIVDELMLELQTVETMNCIIERTETPPFFRLTSMRKSSSPTEGNAHYIEITSQNDSSNEKGTFHTKRHSGDGEKIRENKGDISGHGSLCSGSSLSSNGSVIMSYKVGDKARNTTSTIQLDDQASKSGPEVVVEDNFAYLRRQQEITEKFDISHPLPLPMPEYGGYFSPLSEFLPHSSLAIPNFHRCNLAVFFLTDLILDGIDIDSQAIDWSAHVPLMLHIILLGMDHTRTLVHEHCKQLLTNLLVVLCRHKDHLIIARILLNNMTNDYGYGLTTPNLPTFELNFLEPNPELDLFFEHYCNHNVSTSQSNYPSLGGTPVITDKDELSTTPQTSPCSIIVTPDTVCLENRVQLNMEEIIKSLVHFLGTKIKVPLWNYEDITSRVWSIKSADQLNVFVKYILHIFQESLPHSHIEERWGQTALQLALCCSSRHYAGRSLQIFRALKVPITTRMLSEILSRLVETVAEQGEDMQGYVTEIMLTLESAVDSLDSDFRPIDFMRELFKSTPNLNKDGTKKSERINSGFGHVSSGTHVPSHARSTSYSVSYGYRKMLPGSPTTETKDMRHRSSTETESKLRSSTNLSRSRSAQSLKHLSDQSCQEDKLTVLSQLFWIAVSVLESDYEYEYLLGIRLLDKVLKKLPLDRPDCREKVEKIQNQLKWNNFPGVHALLLKGLTSPNTYEASLFALSQFTTLLDIAVIDPSQSNAFPMNVIALLPYMVYNYDEANELCIKSADKIAQICMEKSKKLENLATVMTLYSRRTFSKESFQWTRCVVKYLFDTYSHWSLNMIAFLVEVLEKGPTYTERPILNILHCLIHYVDINIPASLPMNGDILRVIAKYLESQYWKEALKILKLVVTRSSSLGLPPTSVSHFTSCWEPYLHAGRTSFAESDISVKKELPGRTMEFTFDVSQTPVIGRRFPIKVEVTRPDDNKIEEKGDGDGNVSPKIHNVINDHNSQPGWKRPWMSQARVRECLVNLLNTCGQRVGLPKSPSVIFSQSSDALERQSSMASSLEEMSGPGIPGDSGENKLTDTFPPDSQLTVFKDFDFLEYELESYEEESVDNFNWGVRRPSLSNLHFEKNSGVEVAEGEGATSSVPSIAESHGGVNDESSDDEVGFTSSIEGEHPATMSDRNIVPPSSLPLHQRSRRDSSCSRSSSEADPNDLTPCNASPSLSIVLGALNPMLTLSVDTDECWRGHVQALLQDNSPNIAVKTPFLVAKLFSELVDKLSLLTRDCSYFLQMSEMVQDVGYNFQSVCDVLLGQTECPFVHCSLSLLTNTKVLDKHRFFVLELHEHFETFLDKREHVLETLDPLKATLKIATLEGLNESYTDEQIVDLYKALHKLDFQMILFFETYSKMLAYLSSLGRPQSEFLKEITSLKAELSKIVSCWACDDVATETCILSNQEAERTLMELLASKQYMKAIKHFRSCRGIGFTDVCDDDVISILSVYCKYTTDKKVGHVIMLKSESDLTEVSSQLMNLHLKTLTSVNILDKGLGRERSETLVRRTEC